MGEWSGPVTGFTVLHDALVRFPSPPTDSSPWSTAGHEYSAVSTVYYYAAKINVCPLHVNIL